MSQPGSLRSLWLKWKSLSLPWRRKRLIGVDLSGTTFWELRNDNLPSRPRRMAVYPQKTHASDVILAPAWVQWLRHTRPVAPSIEEQQLEVQRQENMKQLAAAADRRWEEKPSYLDAPEQTAQAPPEVLQPRDQGGYEGAGGGASKVESDREIKRGVKEVGKDEHQFAETEEQMASDGPPGKGAPKGTTPSTTEGKESPWTKHSGGPSEGWQPQAWSPGRVERR